MQQEQTASVRLYVIQAREAPTAVVFRRGPSKHVLLVRWDLNTDQFETGQWLNGRIYERRCDLSSRGRYLAYFAANYKEPLRSWTAISKPPFLTALAMWPKGDGWGGGGLFENETRLLLNHRQNEMELGDGFRLPESFQIEPLGDRAGWGEDDPIWGQRLVRDGWILVQDGKTRMNEIGDPLWIEFDPPEVWSRRCPRNKDYELQMTISGLHERNGSWYVTDHLVTNSDPTETLSIGRSDWADWSHNGDLLFAKNGCIFRLKLKNDRLSPLHEARRLVDLSDREFQLVEPTVEATRW